jgi:hypothetical protein
MSIAGTAPASHGGATITNYEYSTDNGATWKVSPVNGTSPVVITIRPGAAGSGTESVMGATTPREIFEGKDKRKQCGL